MIRTIKEVLKPLIPNTVIQAAYTFFNKRANKKLSLSSPEQAFSAIYKNSMWDGGVSDGFCSGSGSHHPAIVEPYLEAVTQFLEKFPIKPHVVDLGCGDFNVGSKLRHLCNQYIACDVVPDLIYRNKTKFSELDVDFRHLDITKEPLPAGEIVFIRQVLQHLTNDHIKAIVSKLLEYKFLVLTEHLPIHSAFVPNMDKPLGHGIRLDKGMNSGVVLTLPPFNLAVKSQYILCEVSAPVGPAGLIRTIVYELNSA